MADAGLTLQGAIYGALTSPTIGCSVYDQAPQDAAYPHVEVGASRDYDWSASLMRGEQHRFEVHVWSRYRGFKEARELMATVKQRLHEVSLTLTGNSLVDIRYRDSELFTDADGLTRHGIVRFDAMTTKT